MVLVFDVGATHTRIALSEDGETLGDVVRMDTHNSKEGFNKLCSEVGRLAGQAKPEAAAGGLPGQIEPGSGVFSMAANLTSWNGIEVLGPLKEAAGCDVLLSNDVVMAGLGEARASEELNRGVTVYFTVSTGVNAVRIVNGWPDETIKQFNVGGQLLPDAEGRLVSLETLTGGKAFQKRKQVSPSKVRDGRSWRSEELHLARGLYNTILHWTPDAVVFGGSMMRDIDLPAVSEELAELPRVFEPMPKLGRAVLGDLAGLRGSLAWLQRKRP